MVEYGVAKAALEGHDESGDQHVICGNQKGVLIAAIDGIGHGGAAAAAAGAAASVLMAGADEPIISLVEQCQEKLRSTRGVVMSLASIDTGHGLMTWLGIGNVQGVLMRVDRQGNSLETLLLRGGVVGSQLPPLQATVLQIARGDTIYLVTDGIQRDFAQSLTPLENPQRAADRILEQFRNENDDALVLVARLTGRP